MEEYQNRVKMERSQLDERRIKLREFIDHNGIFKALPEPERNLLCRQLAAMTEYSEILSERIAAFPSKNET